MRMQLGNRPPSGVMDPACPLSPPLCPECPGCPGCPGALLSPGVRAKITTRWSGPKRVFANLFFYVGNPRLKKTPV